MRYWEFLIQQEGDQTWLPLETRQVEILEGRYRMAAHTSYDSTSVEIRVSQLLLDEIPPRRRVRKRKANTNDSGLLAIFPFIQLSAGRWEIECNSPDVIDDFLGEGSWHYSVQLQVTPRDEDDWDPDWSENTTESSQKQPLEIHGASPEYRSDAEIIADGTTDGNAVQATEFQLQLQQQAYVTQLGQPLTLSGQLFPTSGAYLRTHYQLLVELRDPQTASTVKEILFEVPQPPSPFSVTIPLPEDLSTQVILGAISLIDRNRSQDETVLTSASFTVTLGLAQMLDAIANQPNLEFEEEISIFPGSTEAFVPPPAKAEALLTKEIPIAPKEIIPSEGFTLPPQLTPPSEQDLDPDRQPELPTFPPDISSFQADDVSVTAEDSLDVPSETSKADEPKELVVEPALNEHDESDDIDEFEFDPPDVISESTISPKNDVPVEEPPAFAKPQIFELSSIEDDDLDLELATAALDGAPTAEDFPSAALLLENSAAPDVLHTPPLDTRWAQTTRVDNTVSIDRAFEKLQLRERFWQKLSLFTQDGYRQSLEVKRALKTSDPPPEGNYQRSNEFVVYDTPRESRWSEKQEKQESADPIQVYPPILDVPQQELVSGEWLAIRVRIPAGNYQPYVKVWMNDLQTRTVIDSPRLLMQFTPNDNNELETLMRVQIPQGCLELQFAAISVDMTTLQESRKVVQNRRVMPPGESLSVFDDWDV